MGEGTGGPPLVAAGDGVREMHLRRMDEPGKLHRRAVSVITIEAPLDDVILLTTRHNLTVYVSTVR